jgi:mono/diheme cytochrome c family protein
MKPKMLSALPSSLPYILAKNKMPKAYVVSVIFAGLLLVLSTSYPAFAVSGDILKGKTLFQGKCVTCHGPEGKGDGPMGKMLKPPAADFTSAASKKKSEEELRNIIENGKPNTSMVAWKGSLSDTEIQDLLAYVLTLRK